VGASNVAKVFTYWRHLNHREARLLTYMANVALDQAVPPVYFGGWEAGATAIGMDPEKKPASSKETFRQAMSLLRAAGAVVTSGQARAGVRAEYALALDPKVTYLPLGAGRGISWSEVRRDKATLPQEGQENIAPHNQGHIAPTGTSPRCERGKATLPPRNTQEPQEEYKKEDSIGLPVSPVDTSDWSVQDERNRQSALLLQRQAEYEQNQRQSA